MVVEKGGAPGVLPVACSRVRMVLRKKVWMALGMTQNTCTTEHRQQPSQRWGPLPTGPLLTEPAGPCLAVLRQW